MTPDDLKPRCSPCPLVDLPACAGQEDRRACPNAPDDDASHDAYRELRSRALSSILFGWPRGTRAPEE